MGKSKTSEGTCPNRPQPPPAGCGLKGGRGENPAGLTLGGHPVELLFITSDNVSCGRSPVCMNTAESLARALNRLRAYSTEAESRQRMFTQQVVASCEAFSP